MAYIIKGRSVDRASTVISTCKRAGAKRAEFVGKKEPLSLVVEWYRGLPVTYPATIEAGDILFPKMLDNDIDDVMTPMSLIGIPKRR